MWDRVMAVNVKGALPCSRSAAPSLRRAGGAIVNVSSVAGILATGSSLPYGVSKAALTQLTRALAPRGARQRRGFGHRGVPLVHAPGR
jgi:3-oxoacyl-[acyl-carrier protein] reductase